MFSLAIPFLPSNNIKVQNKDPKVLTIDKAKVRKAPTYLELVGEGSELGKFRNICLPTFDWFLW